MSDDAIPKYSSSASDGNLAEIEDESFENKRANYTDELRMPPSEIEKQVFFTLPRWMSGRRKSRRKIKDIKVDVPYKAKEEFEDLSLILLPKNKEVRKKSDSTISIFSKIFKKSQFSNTASIISSSRSQSANYKKLPSRVPTSYVISTSNTDIRSHTANTDVVDCHEYFKGKTPAVCGIKNHGNTCFMNAVIQCLSGTDFFAEYFVMDQYKVDFLRRNKIHAKKYGTKGEVTEQLGTLIKSLWSCQYYPDISYKFKHLVAKFGSQYEGNNQHDAQEFLLWLLDKVHEDLNTAPKQKYKKPKSSCGRQDEDLAAETMANHLRCNNSFIHDLFQGQFRSSLSCPCCRQRSNTFDPYLCVSLPVPHSQSVSFFVHLVLLDQDNILKIGLTIDCQATFKMVQEKISTEHASLIKQKLILTEFSCGEFGRTFSDSDMISNMGEIKDLHAFETPAMKSPNSDEGEQMILIVVNKVRLEKNKYETFWRPFAICVPREANFKCIQEKIISSMSCIPKDTITVGSSPLFRLRVIDGVPIHEVLPDSVELPLYMPVIDHALTLSDSSYNRGPKHVKIGVEWKKEMKEKYVEDKGCIDIHSSALNMKNSEAKVPNAGLYECFDTYFKEEKLGLEDAWMCPYCHRRLQGVKQLSLWTVPDIFIVHLKRFRQTYCQRTKVTTLVEFPLLGLDMNAYIASRNSEIHTTANGNVSQMAMWSPWRRPRSRMFSRSEDNVYDLYAVCNHHGSMQGGHYTAYCKNPVDGHWYLYDDDKVQLVQDTEVMTANAYLLFYQRSTSTHSCASSSTSGYSSASSVSLVATEHWAFRMPPFLHILPKTSKSQDNLCNMMVGSAATLDRRNNSESRPFTRAARSYSSMICFNDIKGPLSTTSDGRLHSDDDLDAENVPPPPPPPSSKRYWTITSV